MNRIGIAASLMILSAGAALARAGQDDGFTPLFNGKDLQGWVTPEDRDLFRVEDGEIVGQTRAGQLKKNEFLVTDRDYTDFELKAKVKILGGNSGIQVRSTRAKDGAVAGPQVDVADGFWGVLYDERGPRGIIERYPPEKANALVRKGDWNDLHIRLKGNHLTVQLNGTTILDRDDPQFPKSGVIALQVHQGPPMEVRFKDLAIKDLSKEE
jgi:hypothetical protein